MDGISSICGVSPFHLFSLVISCHFTFHSFLCISFPRVIRSPVSSQHSCIGSAVSLTCNQYKCFCSRFIILKAVKKAQYFTHATNIRRPHTRARARTHTHVQRRHVFIATAVKKAIIPLLLQLPSSQSNPTITRSAHRSH